MNQILDIELTGIQQEWSLDILLNESNRLNNTIKGIDESIIQEGIGDVLKTLKDKVVQFVSWLWNKIKNFFGTLLNKAKELFSKNKLDDFDEFDDNFDDKYFVDFDDDFFEDDNIDFEESAIITESSQNNVFENAVNFFNKYYKGKEIKFGSFTYVNVIKQYYRGVANFYRVATEEAVVPKKVTQAREFIGDSESIENFIDQINKDKENIKSSALHYMTSTYDKTSESTFSNDVIRFYTEDALGQKRFSVNEVTSKNLSQYSKDLVDCAMNGSYWIEEIKKSYNSFKIGMDAIKKNCILITNSEDSKLVNAFISYNSVATEMGLKLVSIGNTVTSYWRKEAMKIIKKSLKIYSKFRRKAIRFKKSENK